MLDTSADRYGFYGDDWDEDVDSELGGDLNKDSPENVYDDDSFQPYSMDYDDPLLYQDQPYYPSLTSVRTTVRSSADVSVKETLRMGLEDPTIRQEMLRMINKKKG